MLARIGLRWIVALLVGMACLGLCSGCDMGTLLGQIGNVIAGYGYNYGGYGYNYGGYGYNPYAGQYYSGYGN